MLCSMISASCSTTAPFADLAALSDVLPLRAARSAQRVTQGRGPRCGREVEVQTAFFHGTHGVQVGLGGLCEQEIGDVVALFIAGDAITADFDKVGGVVRAAGIDVGAPCGEVFDHRELAAMRCLPQHGPAV